MSEITTSPYRMQPHVQDEDYLSESSAEGHITPLQTFEGESNWWQCTRCPRPKPCNWCCCGYILLILALFAGVMAVMAHFYEPFKPHYEAVYIHVQTADPQWRHDILFVNVTGWANVLAKNQMRVSYYARNVKLEVVLDDWKGNEMVVGEIQCCHPAKYAPSQKNKNYTFSMSAPSMPESVIYRLWEEEKLRGGSHIIPLGLRGYGHSNFRSLGFHARTYIDCKFSLNGSVFAQNHDIDTYDTQTLLASNGSHPIIDRLLNQTWELQVINQSCTYSINDFNLFA